MSNAVARSAPLRWGILGAARIARALIPAIRAAGGEVVALGVRSPASPRARAFAEEWNVPLVGDYGAVLGSQAEAVYVPLPNDLHLPWTLRALEAGKHVLTEKPLTLDAAEAEQAARAAGAAGRVLLEAFAYRFQPWVTRLREIAASGELGTLRAASGSFGFTLTRPDDYRWETDKGGGALYDVGTYPVNLIRLLLGEPGAVSAAARWAQSGVDLGLSGVLHYPGALASVSCGFDWSAQAFTLVGTGGRVEVSGVFGSNTSAPTVLHVEAGGERREEQFEASNGYQAMVEHFQRVAAGEEAPRFAPSDAVAQARVLDALRQAARTGGTVRLPTGPLL